MEQVTRGCVGELGDIRRETHWDFIMLTIVIQQLMDLMLPDYQSHTVIIHVSIFGLLLVVVVKSLLSHTAVVALTLMHMYLHTLVVATTVNQLLGTVVIMGHISLMTLCGMEQDAQIIAVMILPNLGSIVS